MNVNNAFVYSSNAVASDVEGGVSRIHNQHLWVLVLCCQLYHWVFQYLLEIGSIQVHRDGVLLFSLQVCACKVWTVLKLHVKVGVLTIEWSLVLLGYQLSLQLPLLQVREGSFLFMQKYGKVIRFCVDIQGSIRSWNWLVICRHWQIMMICGTAHSSGR